MYATTVIYDDKTMAKIKWLFNLINSFFIAYWGLNLLEVVVLISSGSSAVGDALDIPMLDVLSDWVKIGFAVAGLVYFVVWKLFIYLPHKRKMQQLEYEKERLELELLKRGKLRLFKKKDPDKSESSEK